MYLLEVFICSVLIHKELFCMMMVFTLSFKGQPVKWTLISFNLATVSFCVLTEYYRKKNAT